MPKSRCLRCGAGSTVSFNWEYAVEASRTLRPFRDLSVFSEIQVLRQGGLFRCTACHQRWYLGGGKPRMMHAVAPERELLIQRWSDNLVPMKTELGAQLAAIGRTPPDKYGNGSEYHETPCLVKTAAGEIFETAVVSLQSQAPYEDWRDSRLAVDIVEIAPSPYALSLEVRVGCSQADETRMGYRPTVVESPNGDLVILNGTQHFLSRPPWKGPDFKLSRKSDPEWPSQKGEALKVVYFIADPA